MTNLPADAATKLQILDYRLDIRSNNLLLVMQFRDCYLAMHISGLVKPELPS